MCNIPLYIYLCYHRGPQNFTVFTPPHHIQDTLQNKSNTILYCLRLLGPTCGGLFNNSSLFQFTLQLRATL